MPSERPKAELVVAEQQGTPEDPKARCFCMHAEHSKAHPLLPLEKREQGAQVVDARRALQKSACQGLVVLRQVCW